ncbi:hypothetical protein INR49_026308 [Caranx melampygus]|nr:hypothetical protein INR49_026308 [Caranx melampygus]
MAPYTIMALMLTRHPVGGKVMVDDLILQVDGGHVLWVGHSYGEQDAHQQVDYLKTGNAALPQQTTATHHQADVVEQLHTTTDKSRQRKDRSDLTVQRYFHHGNSITWFVFRAIFFDCSKFYRERRTDNTAFRKTVQNSSSSDHQVCSSEGVSGKLNLMPSYGLCLQVITRYGQQAELKEQNQHLMTVNEELQKNLTETQQRVAELELQFSDLEKENTEVQKQLKDCHVLLVAAKIDPVLGERVGEAAQQNEDQRKEAMSVSADLLNELRTFGDTASQQRARLEEIQATMTDLTKAREHMMQERENFCLEAAEMEKALKEAEVLLL